MKFKKELLILMGIAVVYFLVRLPHLTLQPIFADEAIYVRWAQVMRADPTLRFISLTDGKTPLYMWIMIPFFKAIKDPLLAGRFLSILSGWGTLLGVYFLSRRFFNPRVALWASLMVAVVPLVVFFDRLALVDSMLAAFTIWVIFLGLWLVERNQLDIAMLLGFGLGSGILTKTPGYWNVVLLPLTLITYDWKSRPRKNKLIKFLGLWLVAGIITVLMYGILKLGPGLSTVNQRNQDYIYPLTHLISSPFDPSLSHLHAVLEWGMSYLGPVILLVIAGGIFLVVKNRCRVGMVLILWSLIPLIIQAALIRSFTARYILFSGPPLFILGAVFLDWLWQKRVKGEFSQALLILLVLTWPVFFISRSLIGPHTVPLIGEEKQGYFEEWTAGYGLKEVADYLRAEGQKQDIVVGTEGSFGTLPEGLQIYLNNNPHVAIIPGKEVIPLHLYDIAREHPTYFVSNRELNFKYPVNTEVVMIYRKPNSTTKPTQAIILFRVLPLNTSSTLTR